MILDSGASDCQISKDLEYRLASQNLISKESYLDPGLYKLADGSIVLARRLQVPSLKVGSFEVKNLICSVTSDSEVLLLGQSFLRNFKKWYINNDTNTLTLER